MKKISILLLFLLPAAAAARGWGDMKRIEKQIVAPVFPDAEYRVGEFGATGNGTDDDRPAIQAAIDRCSDQGGGRVVLAAGHYFSRGPIILKSNVDLHLAEGSVLIFSADERDYLPVVLTRWEGTEVFNYSPLIYARNAVNIAITGRGVLNGQGSKNFATWKPSQKPDQQMLRKQGNIGVPIEQRIYGEGHRLRPAMLELLACTNVLIEGIKIIDITFWTIHPIACTNVIVRNVTVDSTNLNNDGVDPESCYNVLVEGCYFRTGDDAIAVKSGRDGDAWRNARPTENVIIRNCVFDSKINGLCIGSEISGGARNIFMEDIEIRNATNAIYFKSNNDRGAYIEDVHVRRIRAGHVSESLIKFEPDYKSESKGNAPTRFANFTIEDVTAERVDGCGVDIAGCKQMPVRNVQIDNVKIGSEVMPMLVNHVEDISIKKLYVNGKRYDRDF